MLEIMKQVNDITSQLETTIQDQEAALLAQIQTSIEVRTENTLSRSCIDCVFASADHFHFIGGCSGTPSHMVA